MLKRRRAGLGESFKRKEQDGRWLWRRRSTMMANDDRRSEVPFLIE